MDILTESVNNYNGVRDSNSSSRTGNCLSLNSNANPMWF